MSSEKAGKKLRWRWTVLAQLYPKQLRRVEPFSWT
jgi:hypothetical protein